MSSSRKTCQRCDQEKALDGFRYCRGCLSALWKEMRESGYLTPVPHVDWLLTAEPVDVYALEVTVKGDE